jgi:hypothetical protein
MGPSITFKVIFHSDLLAITGPHLLLPGRPKITPTAGDPSVQCMNLLRHFIFKLGKKK